MGIIVRSLLLLMIGGILWNVFPGIHAIWIPTLGQFGKGGYLIVLLTEFWIFRWITRLISNSKVRGLVFTGAILIGVVGAVVSSADFHRWRDRPHAEKFNLDPQTLAPEMLVVPAGEFTMGSPDTEIGRFDNEGPQHTVKISKPFALGRYEVTFDEYDAFANETQREQPDDEGWGRGLRPVINVSWDDAQAYAAWLSAKTGKAYRLPTEAEWEYAARAGTTTARYWGGNEQETCRYANVDDQTLYCRDGFARTAPVGRFLPNDFGVHDMLGNVWEWVADCYHESYQGAPTNGSAWEEGDCAFRVLRGGSWDGNPVGVRVASRTWIPPTDRSSDAGFRLARTLN